ncbi:MAG: (Fe-S)-binding protein [Bryobacterales bacterium]|nr:(Fe-S)-binding protein [Bryobacterales bacterium]
MTSPSWVVSLVLAVVLAASATLFWVRFRRVLKIIRAARPEAGWQLGPVLPRLRNFFWEVGLQAKVIRERPLPGLAHAFVFWGFCAFSLVTLDHLAAGFGLRLLDRRGWFGAVYFFAAACFALAVLVSIIGLAIRRFLVRPRWLGAKVSVESGIIALLIATLMATYLADHLLHTGPLVWWLHTLALAVFLPLVPHTKHLHLILGPAAIFLARDGFSQIPPLVGDEDFGLHTGKDITQTVALQAFACVECGRCTQHCPAANTGKLLNPKEIILGMRGYLNQHGPASEEPLLGPHIAQEAAFQCTTCGACEYQCPVGIQHLPVLVGLRRGAVNTGAWEDDYGTKLFLNLERNGNPLGLPASERDKFIQKAGIPYYDGTQDYCLWLGCMGAYDPKGREIVQSLAAVLSHLNVSFGVLRKERCTGDSARRLGNDLVFAELAQTNLETIGKAQVKRMISICPHCVRTISQDWKEFGEAPPIEHHSEFLARHPLPQQPGAGKVTYHDPCYLGRYRGVYDQPRQLAAAAGPLVEPPRSREHGFCCGAGGGLVFLGEEKGKRVNHERAEELIATGAKTIAAACPFCNTMFRDALGALNAPDVQLLDIAQIAAANLPAPPHQAN